MNQLFTDAPPAPFRDYPPTWAYVLALGLGLVPLSALGAAPRLARRWQSPGWTWGLWSTALSVVAMFGASVAGHGLIVGAVETLTSPALVFVVVASCVLAGVV